MLHSTYHYINGCSFWVNQCHRDKGSEEPVEQILCMSCNVPKTGSHWLKYRTWHVPRSPAYSFSRLSRDACTFQLDMYNLLCKSMPEASRVRFLTYLVRQILLLHAAIRHLRSDRLYRAPRHGWTSPKKETAHQRTWYITASEAVHCKLALWIYRRGLVTIARLYIIRTA